MWGVGRDNARDFAYVARDRHTRRHLCHVFRYFPLKIDTLLQIVKSLHVHFRCDVPARAIANALRDICKKILIERSLAQSSSRMGIHANNRLRY